MKVFEIPMVVTSLLGFSLLASVDPPPARADFTFGAPVNIQSTLPLLDVATECIDCFSADGLEVYVDSWGGRPGGYGQMDLWVLKRASVEDAWGPPENLGSLVNSASDDATASIAADGLELYFTSSRPGGNGSWDIYVTKRATRTSPWGPPTNLGPKVNSPYWDCHCSVSADGLGLYFDSGPGRGGYGGNDIYVSTRATPNDPWSDPVRLGPAVNSPGNDVNARSSPDGLLLFFNSDRPGGYGDSDIWMTRRANRSAPWEPAVNLGPMFNGPFWEGAPSVTADGSALYLLRDPANDFTTWTWKAPILPIVDFNGDGKVDLTDLVMLIDNWGTSNSLCDIGPYAWGDGKVDIEDLKVFIAEWEKQNPPTQP